MQKKTWILFALIPILLTPLAAVAQDGDSGDGDIPPDLSGEIARQQFVEELWHHGDVVSFVSVERGFVLLVAGHEELVQENLAADGWSLDDFAVATFITSEDLAYAIADTDPRPGDQQTFVEAECQNRTNPCKAGCTNYEIGVRRYSRKDTNVVAAYGLCERIDGWEGSCTQEYKKICDRENHDRADCSDPTPTAQVINAWTCK